MKKFILLSIFTSTSIFSLNLTPYTGYINYSSNSSKDKAYYGGVYGSYFNSPYKIELDIATMQLKYKNSTPEYKQSDLTLIGTYFKGYNTSFKAGIHNIFINQKNNPNKYDNIVFGGISYYQAYKFNLGLDVYRSDYDGFNVVQLSPKYGFNFGKYNSKLGSFYGEAQLNFIDISKANIASKRDYINLDLKLQNFNGPFTTEVFASIGKNAYKVAKGGFAVYNLKEEYKYSYGASVGYTFKDKSLLKSTYIRSKFSEEGQDVSSNNYLINFSKTW